MASYKIYTLGALSFQIKSSTPQQIEEEIAHNICSEVAAVQAYCRTWQASASYLQEKQQSVENELKGRVHNVVYPWPGIESQPTPYREDGRFSKSYPLEFPFGVGDLHQPRIRNGFSVVEWAQHLLQYYDGRCISSRRGNRLTWAIYNEAMRDVNYNTGRLVYRNTNEQVLTKGELRELLDARTDLVQKIASFGADIPTTPMMWKREGNHLEWIVRQMSWMPPWAKDEREDHFLFKNKGKKNHRESSAIEDAGSTSKANDVQDAGAEPMQKLDVSENANTCMIDVPNKTN